MKFVFWKKNVGDFVKKDEVLLEISTDKVDSEIPSPIEGTLIEIIFNKNDVVEVGSVIALIGDKKDKESVLSVDSRKKEKQKNSKGGRIQRVCESNNLFQPFKFILKKPFI